MARLLVTVLVVGAFAAGSAGAGTQVAVTACGQLVERGMVGVLMADLDCGHQWGLCRTCGTCSDAVEPPTPCSSQTDCPDPAVNVCAGIEPTPSVGVFVVPGARLMLNGHAIRRAQFGVFGGRPDFTSTRGTVKVLGPGTISATREAVRAYQTTIADLELHDNLFGVSVSKLKISDSDASGNTIGISAFDSLRAKNLVADDNRDIGALSYRKARIASSHLTGNSRVDIVTELRPGVRDTVCDRSAGLEETPQPGVYEPSGPPWGVCAGD